MSPKPLSMPIYMDHNATTPVDPRVVSAMRPYCEEMFGNAASNSHAFGWQAQSAVTKARTQMAETFGCRTSDVIWTSGATESNNLAILGVVKAYCNQKPHLITQATEHKAVLEVMEAAQELGAELTVLPVDENGCIRMQELKDAIRPNTVMVSIMMANNEVGSLQPVEEIAALCRDKKIIFHSDAAQGACKISCDLKSLAVDMLSISGHKIYGPKGVGALIVRKMNRDFELRPLMFGGEQERGLRPGTLNVAGVVGLGEACVIGISQMKEDCEKLTAFQTKILNMIRDRFPQVKINGPLENRLCNNISLSFDAVGPEDMALGLSGIAYSSSSACNSGNPKPSHVLKAMGRSDGMARNTLRLGLGRFTTPEEVDVVIDKLSKMLGKVYS